jgi:hypothetical protein
MTLKELTALSFCHLLALSGCNKVIDDSVELNESRKLHAEIDGAGTIDAASSVRFPVPKKQAGQGPLEWHVPEGWTPVEGNRMRMANFRFGEKQEGECYLATLDGSGGGLAANVNRWRSQLGLKEIGEDAVEALPVIEMMGGVAYLVDISGTYTGMRDKTPKPGSRLLGAILSLGEYSLFVKMIGPAEIVDAERDNFLAFCKGLKFNSNAAQPGG